MEEFYNFLFALIHYTDLGHEVRSDSLAFVTLKVLTLAGNDFIQYIISRKSKLPPYMIVIVLIFDSYCDLYMVYMVWHYTKGDYDTGVDWLTKWFRFCSFS